MKKLIARLEDIMVAVTFAESGEYDEANRHSGTTAGGPADQEGLMEEFGKTAFESRGSK